jgi:autotransporter-associated beta strand protein
MKKATRRLCFLPLAAFTPRVYAWLILASATLAVSNPSYAANKTWDGGGADDNWTTGGNWNLDLPPVPTDVLFFGGNTRLTPNNDFLLSPQFNGITFNAGAGAFTIGGNAITLGGNIADNAANTQTINLNMALNNNRNITVVSGGTLSIGGAISETSAGRGLNISGGGTVILSGANSYSGATTIPNNGGVLNIRSSTALGTTAGGMSVGDNSALELQGGIAVGAEALSLRDTGPAGGGALRNISGANSWAGAVTLSADARINSDSGTLTISGNITGGNDLTVGGAGNTIISGAINTTSHTLTKDGPGTLRLDNSGNDYTGGTTLSGGTLQLGANNVIPNTGTFAFSGGTLDANDKADTIGPLSLTANSSILLHADPTDASLTFASGTRTAGTLNIDQWEGSPYSAGTGDRIFFTSSVGIDANFLANVTWSNLNGTGGTVTGAYLVGTGPFELVPVPEPGTIFAGCLVVGIFGLTERKRLRRLFSMGVRS